MGYNDFGDFYYAHGALGDAFDNYVRTRDYCTTSKHIIHKCFNAILVSIEMQNFAYVASYVSKAEQNQEANFIIVAKLCCASGLAQLEAKKYKLAARKFLEIGLELGNNYSEVISAQDVATYGGLCALASFDRAELKVFQMKVVGLGQSTCIGISDLLIENCREVENVLQLFDIKEICVRVLPFHAALTQE